MEANQNGKSKLKFIVAGLMIIILGIGIFFGYAYTQKKFMFDENKSIMKAPKIEKIFQLDTFVINLADVKANRYLKVDMVVGCASKKELKDLTNKESEIRDSIIQILRAKSVDQVSAIEDSNKIKDELKNNINSLYENDLNINIYFVDYIIQ